MVNQTLVHERSTMNWPGIRHPGEILLVVHPSISHGHSLSSSEPYDALPARVGNLGLIATKRRPTSRVKNIQALIPR